MDRLQTFLDRAAGAPAECDARHFRTWQRVSVQVQRDVRSLVAATFFKEKWCAEVNLEHAFTVVVYSSCHPCYGRRPMEFTYDIADLVTLTKVLRLIGRSLQARLAEISADFHGDPLLKRRFLPVWHLDILNAVKKKPRTLIEMLALEAIMVNALIDLGTQRDARAKRRFLKSTVSAARVLGVDSAVLQDVVLRTGAEHLGDGRVFEDSDALAARSPDARIGGDENGDDGRTDGRCQMTNAGIVPDVHACS